jgi:hypothetical protein
MKNLFEALRLRNKFVQDYIIFFTRRGYTPSSPVELTSSDDSVLFTNSTIVPWKNYSLSEPIPRQGVFANPYQPCLRLHCLTDALIPDAAKEKRPRRLLGYFNMLGVLCEQETAERLPNDVLDLLINTYRIPQDKIGVFISSTNDFVGSIDERVRIIKGEQADSEYKWTYGKDFPLFGEGAKIKLLQNNGEFLSFGQIIKISSPQKITFEFGFGIETLFATMESRKDYSPWTVYHCLPRELRFKTLLDIASCFGATATIDEARMNIKHRKEIVRLARRIVKSEKIFGISEGFLEAGINKFINLEYKRDARDYVNKKLEHARKLERQNAN